MPPHGTELTTLAWFCGWLIAVVGLFTLSVILPLAQRARGWRRWWRRVCLGGAAVSIVVLANIALSLHDAHFDLTREHVFTPDPAALEVVARLARPVSITYFYRTQDPNGKRASGILKMLARRNPMLSVRTIDPDLDPRLAASYGVTINNAAVIEAEGRQILVRSTDETEFAIGIQRVLRERTVEVCFIEGHGEYASTNYEFHTHLDSDAGHNHDDANSAVIDTTQHGYGRFRRSLESIGYDVRLIALADPAGIPSTCEAVIEAGPRTTYTPVESAALAAHLGAGGNLLLMLDVGYVLEPSLAEFLEKLGVLLPQIQISDPQNHQGNDSTMVSVTAYEPHPITHQVSFTFFPGVRALILGDQPTVASFPLVRSRAASVAHPFRFDRNRAIVTSAEPMPTSAPTSHILAAAVEGVLSANGEEFRAVVVGDADFASNSFYPYAANSDLALAIIRWLLHEESAVAVQSRIPVPPLLVLTNSQMQRVFVLVEIALPLLVVLAGLVIWWRRR